MKPVDEYFARQDEGVRAVLLAMRKIIFSHDHAITQEWKYGMPFFCYNGKMFCYLWTRKKTGEPYIGFVEGKHLHHTHLLAEKRSRMKILLLDTKKDLPLPVISELITQAINLYKKGVVAIDNRRRKDLL